MNTEKLREQIADVIGQASMCWSEMPIGTFQSDKAVALIDKIEALYKQGRMEMAEEIERELTTPIKMLDTGEETNKITYDCIKHRINTLKLN